MTVDGWEQQAAAAREERDAKIPPELLLSSKSDFKTPEAGANAVSIIESCGLLSADELKITDLANDATFILEQMESKKWTSVAVTTAFCKRAAIAQQLINCLVDFFPDKALARAQELDDYMAKEGKPIGPLHGLPISLKGHMNVSGHDSGAGASVVAWIGKKKAAVNAPIVQILWDAGAVFYCRTTAPEAIMHLETNSPLWGHTLHPLNTALTPGGSSGGESALIAAGGSCMGLGGDIGGSLRGPAQNCGLYTMRCTTFRIPKTGGNTAVGGAEVINSSNGTMTRSLRDVELFYKVQLDAEPWLVEPNLVAMPWTPSASVTLPKKLRVGIIKDDGVVRPTGPMARALAMAEKKLKSSPLVELVPYEPMDHATGISLAHEAYFTDGGQAIKDSCAESGAPLAPLTEWVLGLPEVFPHTMHQLWDLCLRRDAYRMKHMKHWRDSEVDMVLCPAFVGPAPPLETSKYWGYTNIWNILDYPGAVFPTGLTADASSDAQYKPEIKEYRSETERYMHSIYEDLSKFNGMPLCLQVVGPRFADEKVIKMTSLIEEVIKT